MYRIRHLSRAAAVAALILIGSLLAPAAAQAQYMGSNFHGDFGVNSGTQAGPGIYLAIPYVQWGIDDIKDSDGNQVLPSLFQGFDLRGLPPTLVVVTKKKLLGANYGVMVAMPFTTVQPERATLQERDQDWGLNDLYVVPLYLGWHKPRADFVAGYGFFAPTGRYEAGATDNVGLGMWGHEIQLGTTVYLDPARKYTLATTAYFEMHSNKKDQDLKVGTLMTLEGGVAYNVPKIGGAFGLGYFMQQKLTNDSGTDVPELALRALNLYGKNHLFGFGPDVTMAVFQKRGVIGLVNVRYLWETSGKSSFEGNTFVVGFTLAKPKVN